MSALNNNAMFTNSYESVTYNNMASSQEKTCFPENVTNYNNQLFAMSIFTEGVDSTPSVKIDGVCSYQILWLHSTLLSATIIFNKNTHRVIKFVNIEKLLENKVYFW